jgi:hypothetical protein
MAVDWSLADEVHAARRARMTFYEIADDLGISPWHAQLMAQGPERFLVGKFGRPPKYPRLMLRLLEIYGGVKPAAREMWVSVPTLSRLLFRGKAGMREDTIEIILEAVGMTREEAFGDAQE